MRYKEQPQKSVYAIGKTYYIRVKGRIYGFKRGITLCGVWSPPIVKRGKDEYGRVISKEILSPRRSFACEIPEGIDIRYFIRSEILRRYHADPRK